jgi:acetyltransferase-like isoleucine patch superfamily enzyme
MTKKDDVFSINEQELMNYYGYHGSFGKFRMKLKFLRSWILHSLSYSSGHPGLTVYLQKIRGVNIGKNCYIGPYVQIDLLYPDQITIENNVTIATNTMIFAHVNPTASLHFKNGNYSRKVKPVLIKSGAWINPGCIITPGITIGKNSIAAAGSVITSDIPDDFVVVGNPARVVKKSA